MNLNHLLGLTFKARADQPALEFYDSDSRLNSISFGEVHRRRQLMVSVLHGRGLKRGDRICVYLANRVEIIDLYLACLNLGVIFVPINILYKEREIGHILGDADPAAIVTGNAFPVAADTWHVTDLAAEALNSTPFDPPIALDGDDPAVIVYTSGTTGTSKGAILTHNNFAANAINLLACWQITAADRLLLPLPLFHVHGLGNGLHCWLISGCRMKLLERFEQQKAAEHFRCFRPKVFFGVPTIYVRLLDLPPGTAHDIGEGMRLFVSGSAPLPAQVLDDFRERFGH